MSDVQKESKWGWSKPTEASMYRGSFSNSVLKLMRSQRSCLTIGVMCTDIKGLWETRLIPNILSCSSSFSPAKSSNNSNASSQKIIQWFSFLAFDYLCCSCWVVLELLRVANYIAFSQLSDFSIARVHVTAGFHSASSVWQSLQFYLGYGLNHTTTQGGEEPIYRLSLDN